MSELFNLMYAFAKIIGGLGLVLWAGFALTNTPMNQWVNIMTAIGVAVVAIELIKVVLASSHWHLFRGSQNGLKISVGLRG